MEVNPEQPLNVLSPIVVTPDGTVNSRRDVQPENVPFIVVIVEGSVISISPEQPVNA